MNINPTIANYALLTIITKIGKKSFKNIAEKNGISDKTVYRMLRSGRESLKISDAIAQSLFSKAKELKVIIDDTTLRKTFANTMEGIEPHYDTRNANAEPFKTLKTQYYIKGVPDICIVDAHSGSILQRWHSELYEQPIEKTISELNYHMNIQK